MPNGETFMWHQSGGLNHVMGSSGSRTNTSLNSAFVVGTSGAAVGYRYLCPVASPIVAVYFMIDASTGTYANITMGCDINNENATQATRSGTTLREAATSVTKAAAVDQWSKANFTGTYTPAVGEVLWICLKNTSASPTVDYPQILNSGAYSGGVSPGRLGQLYNYSTTNGFTTNGTGLTAPIVVIEHANGDVYGLPFTTISSTYYASNTRRRGIVIPPQPVVRRYAGCRYTANANLSNLELYDDSTAPGGTALQTWSWTSDANENCCYLIGYKRFDTELILQPDKTYRLVTTFASNTQVPQVLRIEDYSSYSSVFDKFYSSNRGDLCYSTIDNGAGGWTDDKSVSPCIGLVESVVDPRAIMI